MLDDADFERLEKVYDNALHAEKEKPIFASEHERLARRAMIEAALSEIEGRLVGKYGPDDHGQAWWNGLIELHPGEAIIVVKMSDEEASERMRREKIV